MKKVGKILSYIFAGFVIFFSLIFIVIEGYNLFSCDWLNYENTINGFFRYFCRFIIAIFGIIIGIFTYFALNKKENKLIQMYYFFGTFTLLISSIIISRFSTNYLDILFSTIPLLYFLSSLLYFIGVYLTKKQIDTNDKNNRYL